MSYLNPQAWDDNDAGGNSINWSSREHKLLYPGYEMLRKALVERCTATGTAIPAVLQTARTPGRIYTGSWFINFHNTVSSLISKFVNHTDSGGDWDGSATFAPNWNEADILTAIGDASRVSAPDMPLAEWSLQQYKILNLLLWEDVTVSQYDSSEVKNGASRVSWAAAVAAYTAYPWTGDALNFNRGSGAGSSLWAAHRARAKAKITAHSVATEIDWYLFMDDDGIAEFYDEGMGFTEDRYWLYQTGGTYAASVTPISDYPTDREDAPPDPGPLVPPAFHDKGWIIGPGNFKAVVKFNVTGGFQFVP